MIDANWTPDSVGVIEEKWSHVSLPIDEDLTPYEAEKLMLTYQAMSEDLREQFVNATYYAKMADYKLESAFNKAFIEAGANEKPNGNKISDRQRDVLAKASPAVRTAKAVCAEADTALLDCKLQYEDCVRSHHSMKKVLDKINDEKFIR